MQRCVCCSCWENTDCDESMKRIVLVTCGAKKQQKRSAARDLYIGPYYRACMDYAEALRPNHIFILSAKYGLLDPARMVDPYDETLNDMGVGGRRKWAGRVLEQLKRRFGGEKVEYTILAGSPYWRYLVDELGSVRLPLRGKGIGKQLQFLRRRSP